MNTTISQLVSLGVQFSVEADGRITVEAGPAPAKAGPAPAKGAVKSASKKAAAYKPARSVTGEFRRLVWSKFPDAADRAAFWESYNTARALVRAHEKRGEKRGRTPVPVARAREFLSMADELMALARANCGEKVA